MAALYADIQLKRQSIATFIFNIIAIIFMFQQVIISGVVLKNHLDNSGKLQHTHPVPKSQRSFDIPINLES